MGQVTGPAPGAQFTSQDLQIRDGLLAGIDPAALDAGALERTLAALERGDRPAPAALSPTPETRALLPPPVWPYVKGNLLSVQWRRRGFHIETAPLVADGAHRTAFLLRVTGGHPVPHHTHKGAELTLVLAGAYSDAGVSYGPGDIQVADPTINHRPVAKPGEDCICIVALEAQACGMPVVGAATPGASAVVAANHTGLLVPAGDVAAFAAATRRLVTDAALRRRMSAAAFAYVREHHDIPRAAAQLDALLRDAYATHRAAA